MVVDDGQDCVRGRKMKVVLWWSIVLRPRKWNVVAVVAVVKVVAVGATVGLLTLGMKIYSGPTKYSEKYMYQVTKTRPGMKRKPGKRFLPPLLIFWSRFFPSSIPVRLPGTEGSESRSSFESPLEDAIDHTTELRRRL